MPPLNSLLDAVGFEAGNKARRATQHAGVAVSHSSGRSVPALQKDVDFQTQPREFASVIGC